MVFFHRFCNGRRVRLFGFDEKTLFQMMNRISEFPSIVSDYTVTPVLNDYHEDDKMVYKECGVRVTWMGDDQTVIVRRDRCRPDTPQSVYRNVGNDQRIDRAREKAYTEIAAGYLSSILYHCGIRVQVHVTSECQESALSGVLPPLRRLYETQISEKS